MKNIFGEKQKSIDYLFRKGVYAVIFNDEETSVLTVHNNKGDYFLPGGGMNLIDYRFLERNNDGTEYWVGNLER